MVKLRTKPTSILEDRHLTRIWSVAPAGRSSLATLRPDGTVIELPGVPDPAAGGASAGLRRIHHITIEIHPEGVCCTAAGITRAPVHRRLTRGTALALTNRGVPTFVSDRTGG